MRKVELARNRKATNGNLSDAICAGYQSEEQCEPLSANPWLRRFADGVAGSLKTAEAWRMLEGRCRMSYLIELLYVYTFPLKTVEDVNRDRHHSLKAKLDDMLVAYDELIHTVNEFTRSPEAKRSFLGFGVNSDLNCVLAARKNTYEAREYAKVMGSRKTKPRERYLHEMACILESATVKKRTEILLDLIDIAHQARDNMNGSKLGDAKSLDRRIQRFRKRAHLPPPSTANSRFSFRDFLSELKIKD
jgi:hypothetical protein